MRYIGNAFSLNMIDSTCDHELLVKPFSLEKAKEYIARFQDWSSCIGHEDTARIVSSQLGKEIPAERKTLALQAGDVLLVAQYSGPRLPEGATSLPEGAKIVWLLVEIKHNSCAVCGQHGHFHLCEKRACADAFAS